MKYILKNDLKIIYKKSESKLTSISISVDAGAIREEKKLGIAHATEHLVYKGTKNRSEKKINEDLSRIFGFQNAMTNYPYVIYYGTSLEEDFDNAIELFSDIIINPIFEEKGFLEEMEVIKEELKEWDEDLEQYTEDNLFFNSFKNRRIKYPIIGRKEDLDNMKLKEILNFYNNNYSPQKTSIAIVTSLSFEYVKEIVGFYFEGWQLDNKGEVVESNGPLKNEDCKDCLNNSLEESLGNKKFINYKEGINTASVQIVFDLKNLTKEEINSFSIFNEYFGDGVNSILYTKLRTDNSLVYDVLTNISKENGINLYKINYNTSNEKLNKSLEVIEEALNNIEDFNKLSKSIYLAKELSTYETMFGSYKEYFEELKLESYNKEFIINSAKKLLKNKNIEVVRKVEE